MELFPDNQVVGVFRGFREGGMEFHADLALPYRNEFQSTPMHGQFLLVQLETPEEAVLGRIAAFSSEGKLSSGHGEEFNIRAVQEGREVPDDLRKQYLKYRINIRVLGVLRANGKKLTFVPSHRRLPHVGSKVAFLSGEVLREVCGHNIAGAEMGHFALGEYVYAHNSDQVGSLDWMQIKDPEVLVRFEIENLVARRTFIFARAGFGKSNLNKLLFSQLYKQTPTVEKRHGRKVPVGTIIFDPDGEYFWPDDKGRPGLCDVLHLEDKLVVFTSRRPPSKFYGSFVAGGIRLDIRQLRPADVISIALPPERQDQQNVAKLRSLSSDRWAKLVDLIQRHKNLADLHDVGELLGLSASQEAEAIAARSNMTNIVNMLHDPSSQLMGLLVKALEAGKICVIDISQMRGNQGFILSGIILRRIFDRNQQEFTSADPKTIPTIAVIEEAQSVLNDKAAAAEPYISWVKEGRKYDLGALLVTQQPGSIPNEILSQGDNWFIFHLLSAGDLMNVKKANAHFSEDLLSSLLNEPIQGQGIFWSSVGGKPYPIPLRALSFERLYQARDLQNSLPAIATFATELRRADEDVRSEAAAASASNQQAAQREDLSLPSELFGETVEQPVDIEAAYLQRGVEAVRANEDLMRKLETEGVAWMGVLREIEDALPLTVENKNKKAFELTPKVMTELFGEDKKGWHSFKNSNHKTCLKKGPVRR